MNTVLRSATERRQKSDSRITQRPPQPLPGWLQGIVLLLFLSNGISFPRGHVLSENYASASGTSATLRYHFDADTAGLLGLRTGVGLTGAATGSNTESFNGLAQLTQQATTGTLNDPRGTPVLTNPTASPIDAVGQITAHDPGTNNDALTWDSLGRLLEVSRRDSSNNGFDWTAVYDGFGRRLSTSNQPVVGGVDTGSATTTASEYDPETEFMEAASAVGTSAGTQRRWLVHGPDLNEAYGGAQGTGGIEAVVDPVGGTTTGVMSDAFGHTVATGSGTTANWNAVRSLGYGVQPGTTAQVLDGSHDISAALAWRGKVIDPTGFYYLGSRYYDPASGTFLSCDPLGHAASMDLYSYCNGDPINNFDPDGRLGKGAIDTGVNAIDSASQGLVSLSGATAYGYTSVFSANLADQLYGQQETAFGQDINNLGNQAIFSLEVTNPELAVIDPHFPSSATQQFNSFTGGSDHSVPYRIGATATNLLFLRFTLGEGGEGITEVPALNVGNGRAYLGPFYDRAVSLYEKNPDFFPNPDTTNFRAVTGDELEILRGEFEDSGLSGHHVHPIAHGGPSIPDPSGLAFTGESTIGAGELSGLDLGFYKQYGNGMLRLKIFQPEPGGILRFGLNPAHTEATNFWNEVGRWQAEQGLR